MEALHDKKVAIPLLVLLFVGAVAVVWWSVGRTARSGGIDTSALKGEAAVQARIAEDTQRLEAMTKADLQAEVQSRKMLLQAAQSYNEPDQIKWATESLARAEAVLKTK